jgi:hypothetical protein
MPTDHDFIGFSEGTKRYDAFTIDLSACEASLVDDTQARCIDFDSRMTAGYPPPT